MRITFVGGRVTRFGWPLSVKTANARRSWDARLAALLTLSTADGVCGHGEAAPLPGFSRDDDLDACVLELEAAAANVGEIEIDEPIEATLRRLVAASGIRSAAGTFCFETAVLDAIGKKRGQPVWRLLRGRDAPRPEPVPLAALLREKDPARAEEEARGALRRGIRIAKIKIGPSPMLESDLARLAAVGSTGIALRLDANQSLEMRALPAWLEGLARFAPELLEEPVASGEWASLEGGPVPFAMDESLQDAGWEERLAAAGLRRSCAAIVLKPMALGGFARCLAFARAAARAGRPVIVTHLNDGPIAAAAAAELALSIPSAVSPCGLDGFGRDADWPWRAVSQIGPSRMVAADRCGLDVDACVEAIHAAALRDASANHGEAA